MRVNFIVVNIFCLYLDNCLTLDENVQIFSTQMTQLLPNKIKEWIFKKFFVKITQKNDIKLHKNVKTENDPWCIQAQISQLQLS